MPENGALTWVVFLAVASLTVMIVMLVAGRPNRLNQRLQSLSDGDIQLPPGDPMAEFARTALPKMGAPFVPKNEADRTKLQARLIHAGMYSRQAMYVFLGVKVLVMVTPALIGLALGLIGVVSVQKGLIFGCLAGAFGMLAPSFWLDQRKAARQTSFRRALPDALDVLVICLEGGGTISAAIPRVAGELRSAHLLLARELNIVHRETQLGRSPGDALRQFADRADLEEVRSLAAVILQAERFGASLVKALRVHADSLRVRRVQHAEEMAQKSVVKLLFPTVFFIMPALFIAVLGPTGLLVLEMFQGIKH